MPGVKGRSGNQGWKKNFDAECMLNQSAGRLIYVQNISAKEAEEKEIFTSPVEKGKTEVAKVVFLKLAPSNVNIGGQKDNPLKLLIEQLHEEAEKNEKVKAGRSNSSVA